jgi:hypothetical protein
VGFCFLKSSFIDAVVFPSQSPFSIPCYHSCSFGCIAALASRSLKLDYRLKLGTKIPLSAEVSE